MRICIRYLWFYASVAFNVCLKFVEYCVPRVVKDFVGYFSFCNRGRPERDCWQPRSRWLIGRVGSEDEVFDVINWSPNTWERRDSCSSTCSQLCRLSLCLNLQRYLCVVLRWVNLSYAGFTHRMSPYSLRLYGQRRNMPPGGNLLRKRTFLNENNAFTRNRFVTRQRGASSDKTGGGLCLLKRASGRWEPKGQDDDLATSSLPQLHPDRRHKSHDFQIIHLFQANNLGLKFIDNGARSIGTENFRVVPTLLKEIEKKPHFLIPSNAGKFRQQRFFLNWPHNDCQTTSFQPQYPLYVAKWFGD